MLMSITPQGEPAGPCPLKHTDVKADISGFISRVTVTQEFENPYKEKSKPSTSSRFPKIPPSTT